jgi:hypothetical protein
MDQSSKVMIFTDLSIREEAFDENQILTSQLTLQRFMLSSLEREHRSSLNGAIKGRSTLALYVIEGGAAMSVHLAQFRECSG